jgi:DNA-binding response OmpR family regulator
MWSFDIDKEQLGGPMRFLLVDDEPQIGMIIRRVAEGCGFDVETTTHADGFKIAYEAFRPDLIGLDLAIPDCDGIELIRYLADANCGAGVIVISGMDRKMLNIATQLGIARGLKMAGVISKPMRVAEVRALFSKAARAA